MLVKRINEFTNALKDIYSEVQCDSEFHARFLARFSIRDHTGELTKDDLIFIKIQFKQRWSQIKDTANDYTKCLISANKLWVQLAKDLASEIEETYVQIVFPDVLNTIDYHDLTLLTETENPENFYISSDLRVLLRKKSLCTHLIRNNFVLSTIQNPHNKNLSPLQVDVLARLKLCKDNKISISSIEPASGEEEFLSFWDMLVKKSFPKLNSNNRVALDILPYFLQLLDNYFTLKESKAPLIQFKVKVGEFLKFLYTHELDYVNQFYGLTVEVNDKRRYILDFLIDMDQVQSYDIDNELIILVKWLYNISSQLIISNCRLLKPVYASILSTEHIKASLSLEDKAFNECKLMLLSFFVLDLKCFLSLPITISVWDKENQVFPQLAVIYERFGSLLGKADNKRELIACYREVKKKTIDSYLSSTGVARFFSSMFKWPVDNWYEHVEKCSLTSLGVFWYEPALLMYTLIRFRATNNNTQGLIWEFLDELIHTYCQEEMSPLQKQLRVNIVFFKLMDRIAGRPEHGALRILLNVYAEKEDYQSEFMISCTYYIGNKLRQIDVVKKDISFFAPSETMKKLKVKISTLKIHNVNDLLLQYKEEITHDEEIRRDPVRCNRFVATLISLSKPILTYEESLEAEYNVPGRDTLGATT